MKHYNSKAHQRMRPRSVAASERLASRLERFAKQTRNEELAHWREVEARVRAAEKAADAVEEYERTLARRDRIRETAAKWNRDE